MRLRSITLENFRGFTDRQTVDMDADIVVVWGANGTGKTSLLDGLQWALLGSIPRLDAASLRRNENSVVSRYATGGQFVSIEFVTGDEVWTVNRTGGESSKSRLTVAEPDGQLREGDEADNFVRQLVGSDNSPLRAFLLQQDDMTELLGGDTRERYRFLADLTGLEGLREVDEQLRAELRKLRAAVREREEDLASQRQRVAAAQREIEESRAIVDRQRVEREERHATAGRAAAELLGFSSSGFGEELEARAVAVTEESQRLMASIIAAQDHIVDAPDLSEDRGRQVADTAQLREERRVLDERLKQVSLDLESLERVSAAQKQQRDEMQQLASLALHHLGEHCPVCGQEHSMENTRARLLGILDAHDESESLLRRQADLQEEYASLRQQRRENEARLEASVAERAMIDRQQSELVRSRAALAQDRQRLRELLLLRDAPSEHEAEIVRDRVTEIERRLAALRSASRELQQFRGLQSRTTALEEDLRARTERLHLEELEVGQLLARQSRAEAVCKWVGTQAQAIGAEILDRAAPLADALFRRFDVHPTFRRFGFRPERVREAGHLRPWVFDDVGDEDGNAAQVLSAAQLNALAVSLFLALNLETASKLESALLDDPVQNMDDLNVLSLIDVLRALRASRQIVLTTHDIVLAHLLQSKLRPLAEGQKTLLIKLSRWTPRGPALEIESRDWEPGSADYQLVARSEH